MANGTTPVNALPFQHRLKYFVRITYQTSGLLKNLKIFPLPVTIICFIIYYHFFVNIMHTIRKCVLYIYTITSYFL